MDEASFNKGRSLIDEGISIRQAAKTVGFDESTLRYRFKKGTIAKKLGRFTTVFTETQEKILVDHCIELDKRFFGLTLKSLRFLLYNYAVTNNIKNPFSYDTKLAGKDFTRGFLKRNNLSLREARKTSVARVMGFNRIQINQYFDNLEAVMAKYNFSPDCIYNMNETGVQTVPKKLPKIGAPTGKREVSKSVASEQGQTVSLACAMNAVGYLIPPFFIFARKRLNLQLIKGGPDGCTMAVTDKGYMNTPTFVKWLEHLHKWVSPSQDKPALIILDNHVSHVSLLAVNFAKRNHIHLLSLPPHTSQKTQPLDRSFFRPFKAAYDDAANAWNEQHPGQTLGVYDVAGLCCIAFEKSATVENAVKGFSSTGIYPLDRNKFNDDDFLPAEVTDQNYEDEEDIELEERRIIVFVDNNVPVGNQVPDNIMLHENSPDSNAVTATISPEICNMPVPSSSDLRTDFPNHATASCSHQCFPTSGSSQVSTPIEGTINNYSEPTTSHPSISMTNITRSPLSALQPSCSRTTPPEEIIPLPRIQIKRKRSGRGLKSTLLTSTPHKEHLEQQATKTKKNAKQKNVKICKKRLFQRCVPKEKIVKPNEDKKLGAKGKKNRVYTSSCSSETDENYSVHNSSSDFDFLQGSSENEEPHEVDIGIQQMRLGSFAVVKVMGKSGSFFRLYVFKITSFYNDGYHGIFYKRVPNSNRFSETAEESYIKPCDIYMTLSQPIIPSSYRFQNTVMFKDDLSDLTIY